MATTPKGIYYPNDYNEIADIPEDMKKMAESIDGVFEDTDSDLSDIQEEQTTQNNRLNSLEVDNTTNKSDILTNKQDINNIKSEQTTQNNRLNNLETDNTTNKSNISSNTQEINNIKSEQTTQNTNIQTNADNISALTNRVTETEEDISDIKQEQTEQNTNISTNATNIETLQAENEKLKSIVAQMPQVTGQGTSITLENTIEAQFTIFDVEGNSEQETTEGYNMLDLDKYSYSESSSALNGGIVTIKDGVITLNATNATGNMTALSVTKLANADSIEAGTYYFGVDVYGAYESTPNTNIWEYKGNRTLTEKFIIKQWRYAVTKGNIGSTPILISNDTSKTTYEPYTGGQAAPNPNYEQSIKSAGDNENLFNIDSVTSVIRGQIPDENKVIYTNENTSGNFNVIPNFSTLELKSTTYFISMDIRRETGSLIFGKINDGNSDWTLVKAPSLSNDYNRYIYKKTYSENTSINRMLIQFIGEGSASIKNIKLEQGKASGYSPYGMGSINEKIKNADETEEQDYSIFVQQPMRSIGDVRDCFVKKSDGWYERHYVLRKIFTGTEDWQFYTNSFTGLLTFRILMQEIKLLNHRKILSNNFKVVDSYTPINGEMDNHFDNYYNLECVYTEMNNITEFKNWLAQKYANGNPAYIDYKPETPLDLPCTPEQVEQIENKPSTYKDFTYVVSEDETPAYLEVSGVYDLNKLITRVEVIESEV